jgi:subtilisin family serine protease
MTRPASRSLPRVLSLLVVMVLLAVLLPATAIGRSQDSARYIVVFEGGYALDGTYALGGGYALGPADAAGGIYALSRGYALQEAYALGGTYALYALYALDDAYALAGGYALLGGYALPGWYALSDNYALAREYALKLVEEAGGTVTADLSGQLGVMVVDSKNSAFAQLMSSYALVDSVGQDFGWQQFPTLDEAISSGQLTVVDPDTVPSTGAEPLSGLQWNMSQIRAPQAHAINAGSPKVQVGIVDTGIDGTHLDFQKAGGGSNVDCARGADFTAEGPGVGIPAACVDNNFHGTHVAGIVAARANGHGVVGVAPNVTLVPIKVCDADGHCYASDVVEGITYAGDLALDVINMSFFVDDNEFQVSTEFKCANDDSQRAFRHATERAIQYARNQGVTPVAALGNSDRDLAHTAEGNNCDVVPAETQGVVGTASLGPESGKSYFSNYGTGATDVAAPGGDGVLQRDTAEWCTRQIVSTIPGNAWACFQGTSMASPHATGVAALIVSRFGKSDGAGGLAMSPTSVDASLQKTAVDIGLSGYDKCFGHGRIDALRAVKGETSKSSDGTAPYCPEYGE